MAPGKKFNKWEDNFSHIFEERCPLARKHESMQKSTALISASDFRPPTLNPMPKRARNALSLRSVFQSSQSSQWMTRVFDSAEQSGELKRMMVGSHAIDDDEDDVASLATAEVRTREFIGRQLSGIGAVPDKVQATFMMAAAMIMSPNIAQDEWRNVGPDICGEMGWPFRKSYRVFLASAPRRFGKTRFVSMVILNYALSRPGSVTIVFSTSQATSNLLRQDVKNLMQSAGTLEFAGRQYDLTDLIGEKNNERELKIKSPYNPVRESVIYFNPGLNENNMDKQRGQGNEEAPLIICEELAFWNPRGYINVVQPIMNMRGAIQLGISSPAYDEFNFFTQLQRIKFPNSNQHVCLTVLAELVCKRCRRRNVSAWCTHYNSMLPNWISSEAQFINRLIFKALNMERAAERELGGMTASSGQLAFDGNSMKRMRFRDLFGGVEGSQPKYIGVFIDPNAGGDNEMAIVSVCLVNGAFVICGLDAQPAQNHEDAMQLFHAHIAGLRRNRWTQDAWIILFCERNTGHESGHLAGVLKRFRKTAAFVQPKSEAHIKKLNPRSGEADNELILSYMREADKNPGWVTNYTNKNEFRVDLRSALVQDRIFYLDGCVSENPFLRDMRQSDRFPYHKNKLEEQLARCRVFVKTTAYDTSPDKVFWSGKVNADGQKQGGYNDDLAIMLAAAVSMWDKAMRGELPGFPYQLVRFDEVSDVQGEGDDEEYRYEDEYDPRKSTPAYRRRGRTAPA